MYQNAQRSPGHPRLTSMQVVGRRHAPRRTSSREAISRLIPAVGSPDGCHAVDLTDGTGPSRVTEAGTTPLETTRPRTLGMDPTGYTGIAAFGSEDGQSYSYQFQLYANFPRCEF
jgi:hypothetical protein